MSTEFNLIIQNKEKEIVELKSKINEIQSEDSKPKTNIVELINTQDFTFHTLKKLRKLDFTMLETQFSEIENIDSTMYSDKIGR